MLCSSPAVNAACCERSRCASDAELVVEAREFRLGLIQRSFALGEDQLLFVFDALAMFEHRLQPKDELLHATLISFLSVCS